MIEGDETDVNEHLINFLIAIANVLSSVRLARSNKPYFIFILYKRSIAIAKQFGNLTDNVFNDKRSFTIIKCLFRKCNIFSFCKL